MWRWQLKPCWSCWWWETVYSVTFSMQFLTVLKSFSRLDSNSLTFLQLVKAVKTLTSGATGSIFYFDFACTTNFPFPFLMAPVEKYMRWAYLVNHIICGNSITTAISFRPETSKGRAGCFILRGTSGTSSILLALRSDWGPKATWRGFLLACLVMLVMR